MNNIGLNLARQKAAHITRYGSACLLSDGTTRLPAIKTDDLKTISRFVPVDAIESGEKRPVLFEFAGRVSTAGNVKEGAKFTCLGVPYRVSSVHPQTRQNVCTSLFVVTYHM